MIGTHADRAGRRAGSPSSGWSSSTSSTSSACGSGPRCGKASKSPHYLVMTATPIPRTISMTLFGDLDVTTLREMPPGRQEVRTYVVGPAEQAAVVAFRARETPSGPAGVCRRAAGRRIGKHRRGQRRRKRSSGSRMASWRRFASASFMAACRPAEKEEAMAELPRRAKRTCSSRRA